MPAPTLRPVGPRMTTRPPVMYSQAWSPTPSTTAVAPELRTQKRSPTTPEMNSSPADDDAAPREALREVVVGVAVEGDLDPRRQERPEALPRRAVEGDLDRR